MSTGVAFVANLVTQIPKSKLAASTLILATYDESGGWSDHVAPPPTSAVDQQLYGGRVPLLALGPFAKKGFISHVTMEHSSVVKLIEWNWLGARTAGRPRRRGAQPRLAPRSGRHRHPRSQLSGGAIPQRF